MKNGKFQACPSAPRCVSTQGTMRRHAIDPLPFAETSQTVKEHLLAIIRQMKRTSIIETRGNYIHFEAKTFLMRFVDDAEIYMDDSEKKIHFRSCSRIGYYDFNVNRKRIEYLKSELMKRMERNGDSYQGTQNYPSRGQ